MGGVGSFSETWLDALSDDINENVDERINIQKALFELEDINAQNVYERSALRRRLAEVKEKNPNDPARRKLRGRIDDIDETIRANESLGAKYRKDIDANELIREAIQSRIDCAISEGKSPSFLRILSQYILVGVKNMELHFQLAIRDQIISEQREMIRGFWEVMAHAGLSKTLVQDIANREGIRIDGARVREELPGSNVSAQSGSLWNPSRPSEVSPRPSRPKSDDRPLSVSSPASPLAMRRRPVGLERITTLAMPPQTPTAKMGRAERSRPLSARPVSSGSLSARDYTRTSAGNGDLYSHIKRQTTSESPRRTPTAEARGSARLIEARATRQRTSSRSIHSGKDK